MKFLLLPLLTLAALAGPALAEDAPELGVTVNATYVSKYIWRGYNIFGSHGAFQPSADFDLFGTGLSFNTWASIPVSGGPSDLTEIDYTLAYGTTAFADERYALDIGINYIYYDFPKLNSFSDTEEVGLSLALPSLLPLGDSYVVPSYYVGRLYPTESQGGPTGGVFHIVGLSYDLPVGDPARNSVFSFTTDATYNTGAFDANAGWTHATFGVAASTDIGKFTVSPSLNYQLSFEDSVNDDNEMWAGMSVSYGF